MNDARNRLSGSKRLIPPVVRKTMLKIAVFFFSKRFRRQHEHDNNSDGCPTEVLDD